MKDVLDILGSVPVTTAAIASLYPVVSGRNQKVSALENSGKLIRLKRGLYIVNPEWSGKRINTFLVANHLYSPSYVSMLTALSWHGIIPERVYTVQSMTLKHSRSFRNQLGTFSFTGVSREYFSIGLKQEKTDDSSYIIATPEKALCDLVYETKGINLRSLKETRAYLEEDMRMDMEDILNFDTSILRQCADAGKKTQSIETILKLIRNERTI